MTHDAIKEMTNVVRKEFGKPNANVVCSMFFSTAIEAGLCTKEEAEQLQREGKTMFVYTDTGDADAT